MNNSPTHNINLETYKVKASTRFETEPCGAKGCDKLIYFTCEMGRREYVYRRDIKGKRKYYCGWGHFRKSAPKVKTKGKDKGGY